MRRPGSGSRRWPASPRWLAAAVGLAVYGLGALLAFSPRNPLSTTSLPGGGRGDAVQMAWFLAWTAHALAQRLDPFTTTLLDHPSVVDLADNTSVPLLGLIAAPVTAILGPVAALNVMLRLALFSSGASMFLVLRRWCASSSAAFLGGAIYGFGPYLASHASPSANLDLIFVPVPPLILACLDELICRRRHSALRGGAMLGLLVVAQLLIDPEILAELAVSGMLAAGLLAVSEHRRLRRLFAGLSRRLVVAGAGFVAVFGALSAWPVWSMLAAPGHLSGAVQSPAKLQGFHADLAELVLPAKAQLVDFPALAAAGRAAVASAAALGDTEHTGYLGLPLVLLVVLLAIIWRHAAQVRLGAAIALAALVCELGPRLDVDGHLSTIPLPEGLLAHVPLLWSVIPSRFSLEVCLGVAVVVAVGLDRMLAAGIRSWRGALGLASGVLAVACYLPQLPLVSRPLPDERDVLVALRVDVPPGGVVLSYPYAFPPYDEAMLWQAIDSMRFGLMGGYVTVPDARAGQYWPPLLSPPSVPEALELDEIGRSLHYPRPSRRVVTAPALCSFLDRYAVSAVVMRLGHLVPRQGLVERSLVAALGAPRHFGTTALVWLPAGAASGSASGTSAGEPQWMCRRGSARLSSAPSAG